jgi:hypothetical protein
MRKRMLLNAGTESFDDIYENWYLNEGTGLNRIACQSFKEGENRMVFIFLNGPHGEPCFRSVTQAAPISERRICTRES